MTHRADEIRKRLAKKRKQQAGSKRSSIQTVSEKKKPPSWVMMPEHEKHGALPAYEDEIPPFNGKHPLFKTDSIILKCLLSACLVLVSAIAYKANFEPLHQIKPAIAQTFGKEFQFASASNWFEAKFGDPLAFLTPETKKKDSQVEVGQDLAVPASGKIQQDFQDNGEGITVETSSDTIDSMKEGYIIEVNKDSETGLTVKVQHADNTYSIYGQLKDVDVALYDFVDKGSKLGTIKLDEKNKGLYYFAIKEGDTFVDPIQVITFE
ncbi:peptidoglycan DD-metalloendopeptidase family protein [Bacillus atrophaeus]|uniref:peptidoglycan DD-metalloendopeptidase family protein n=1 Tax=Bacillus atrophaeus TaxID=1452 RepID=UPI000C058195|nr:peptidoglycan DD-metalloendopeptidase family protein [Bacillus atrophaeus]ATO28099.1 stage IV sporulation protein FA [Bacillus atrophaeus]MBU5262793.1 peptidoglycan DD-metalloendopeptidase family protein [Bacillus atrophaeus]MCY7946351.1 peptidoglycan DD-metalloendopeptidase family protein [Bacillus atrophaeus]MCY8095472.1 peptidoglycan DD-metalloendopeptidase family protein [Bacillus atrophaeus]MCY8499789.1 peptidoglycan DD-metalloendopeptidase family protein [Bacillus atrophaeus]